MTIDEVRCKAIIDAVERTEKKVRVTFNYRYAPHNTKVFELLGKFDDSVYKSSDLIRGTLFRPFPPPEID